MDAKSLYGGMIDRAKEKELGQLDESDFDFFDKQTFTKNVKELGGKDVGAFAGTSSYPPNVLNESHSTIMFTFVVPETVSASPIGAFAGTPKKTAAQTTAAGQIGKVGEASSTLAKGARALGMDRVASALEKGAPTKMNETDTQIHLPIPNSFEFSDGATWAPIDADPSFIGLIVNVLGNMNNGEYMKALEGGFWSIVKEMGGAMLGALDEGQSKGLGQAYLKSLENPFTDMAFQTMQRRSFRMSWQLYPKNASEMQQIKGIINKFRFHMHPSLNQATQGSWLDFPSMTIPQFMFQKSPSPFLPKLALSVINSVTVDPTPNGLWTVHTDGNPPHINFSLEFSEVQPLLKEDITLGY